MAELDRGLVQLDDDIARERRLAADAQAALARLAAETDTIEREVAANAEKRAGVDERVARADASACKPRRRPATRRPARSPS